MTSHPAMRMRSLLAGLCLFAFMTGGCATRATERVNSMNTVDRPSFHHGVNISHYLSQIGDKAFADPTSFGKSDMVWIAKRGYDHIRLPIDGPLLFEESGAIRWQRLEAVDEVLDWARDLGLGVILDMHKLPGSDFAFNPDNRLFSSPELQEQAIRLWKGIATRYREVGPELRFELLNEPVAKDPLQLTEFYRKLIPVIRSVSPDRTIIVCSNEWASFKTVRHLEPLLEFGNIVIGVHYYEPHVFTHQSASWVGYGDPGFPPIEFPGKVPDLSGYVDSGHYAYALEGEFLGESIVVNDFHALVAWAEKTGAMLHLGEFGVYRKAPEDSLKNWYQTVLDQCNRHGIGWAVWDYQGAFAVRERRTGNPTVVQEIIDTFID